MKTTRGYQTDGITFLSGTQRAYLGDEPGLGKTYQSLIAARNITDYDVLIVSPGVAVGVWIQEIKDTHGQCIYVYAGTPKRRQTVWKAYREHKDKQFSCCKGVWLITTYGLLKEIVDLKPKWHLVIFDEAHKLRNHKTQIYGFAKRIRSMYMFALSGSPMSKGVYNLWPILHLINPVRWHSRWAFINRFMNVDQGDFGVEIYGVKDVPGLRAELKPVFLRRLKSNVLSELPPKIRRPLYLEMSPIQRKKYDEIIKEQVTERDSGDLLITPNVVSQITRLRQLLVSPHLLGIEGTSAAIEGLREAAQLDFDGNRNIVVYTPFREALPLIRSTLEKIGCVVFTLGANLNYAKISQVVYAFQESPGPKALISTVGSATSYTATAASVAYFIGYDWNPDVNWQAEDRIHRIGQRDAVECCYFVHRGTIDEHVMDILDKKTTWQNLAINYKQLVRPKVS